MKVQWSAYAAFLLLSAVPGALSTNEIKLRGAAAEWDMFEDQAAETEDATLTTQANDNFEAAKPLEFFRNIDPNKFEWVDKSEIQPGETTCGFLKAPLVWSGNSGWPEKGDPIYPTVEVFSAHMLLLLCVHDVCVKFAEQQPASHGNLAVHWGGPSTLSESVVTGYINKALASFNIIGFDQRGFGRSLPTHVRPECSLQTYGIGEAYENLDLTDDDSIRAYAQVFKTRNIECWKHPDFQLTSDSGKTYHFLEHSGTRQLAEDIERVRGLFGDQKLSVHGSSYGTSVFGTYATMFPANVHLMVLDGSINPVSDIVVFSEDQARSLNQRIDYFIAGCEFGDGCVVDDVSQCVRDLHDVMIANKEVVKKEFAIEKYGRPASTRRIFSDILNELSENVDKIPAVCSAASQKDFDKLNKFIQQWLQNQSRVIDSSFFNIPDEVVSSWDSESKPTINAKNSFPGSDPNWPFENYNALDVSGYSALIFAQDMAFGAYNEDFLVETVKGWNEKYPGAFTQQPAVRGLMWYASCYYWPKSTPLSPIGNAELKGIVAGQVYDPATPYIGTQKMRQNFQNMHLLTSRVLQRILRTMKDAKNMPITTSKPASLTLLMDMYAG
eukprot:scaffold4513_cov133-Skeletonema_menzelii.AAC.1